MKTSKWKEIVGKRVLLLDDHPLPDPAEANVMEISPSGKFVRIRWAQAEHPHWVGAADYDLLEVLGSAE